MRKEEAIAFFGSQAALARALGIEQPSVSCWGDRVPWRRQLQLERITNGALKHSPGDIPEDMRLIVRASREAV